MLQKRLAWALFVLLLSTLVCCQPTELILGFIFCCINFQFYSPPPPADNRNRMVTSGCVPPLVTVLTSMDETVLSSVSWALANLAFERGIGVLCDEFFYFYYFTLVIIKIELCFMFLMFLMLTGSLSAFIPKLISSSGLLLLQFTISELIVSFSCLLKRESN